MKEASHKKKKKNTYFKKKKTHIFYLYELSGIGKSINEMKEGTMMTFHDLHLSFVEKL